MKAGTVVKLPLEKDRYGWLQIAVGEIEFEGKTLYAGDAVSFSLEDAPTIKAQKDAEILFYDLD